MKTKATRKISLTITYDDTDDTTNKIMDGLMEYIDDTISVGRGLKIGKATFSTGPIE